MAQEAPSSGAPLSTDTAREEVAAAAGAAQDGDEDTAVSGKLTYRIEMEAPSGVSDFLKNYLDVYRAQKRKDLSAEDFLLLVDRAPDNVKALLKTEGYFEAQATVRTERDDGGTMVHLTVTPGPQVTVSQVNVRVTGDIERDEAMMTRFRNACQRWLWRLPQGAPFNQQAWDESKRRVHDYIAGRVYATARITHSEARIDPRTHQAELILEIDSGPPYTFGEITFSGIEHYPEKAIDERIRIEPGDEYRQRDVLELQNDLQNLPYFNGVVVEAQPSETPPYVVPLNVTVQEAPHNRLDLGIGYSTNYGPRILTQYTYNNVLNRGWVFDTNLNLSQDEQQAEVGLSFPKLRSGYEHRLFAAYSDSDVQGITARTGRLGVTRKKTEGKIERLMGFEFVREKRHDDYGEKDDLKALPFNYRWTRHDVITQRNPRRGNIVQLEASVAFKGLATDESFVRLYGRGVQYWPVGKRDVTMLRLEAGQTFAHHPEKVPMDYLFRAGGSNSVRGYDYQSLGVIHRTTTWPGRVLATGSLEYQHEVIRDWRAAVFVDYGDAADRWQEWHGKTGVGVGARWASPVGMLGADLAYGIDDQQWRFYFSLGLSF